MHRGPVLPSREGYGAGERGGDIWGEGEDTGERGEERCGGRERTLEEEGRRDLGEEAKDIRGVSLYRDGAESIYKVPAIASILMLCVTMAPRTWTHW